MQVVAMRETDPRDASGLEVVFRDHHTRVFQAAYRVTGNAADAEDVLQNVFLRLTHKGGDALPVENPSSYLYRTAVNAALDLLRTRRAQVPVEEADRARKHSPERPDEAHARTEIGEELRRALATLPPRAAEVVALRYLEGYGNHEIARMLDLSRVTVAVILHRARHRLQKELRSMRSGR